MTQRFTLFSQESDDFALEIKIDACAKFAELHHLILQECHFKERGNHAFLICDEDWHVEHKVFLRDDGSIKNDEDVYLMNDTFLSEFLEEEGQRIAYIFDTEEHRYFLIELTENIFGKPQSTPIVSKRHGVPPLQFKEEEIEEVKQTETFDTGEQFYGDDGFEEEDFDPEGFEISEA